MRFFASFWPQIHQFSWWMDHWTRLRQSKFKFAKSSHTASKTGRVVNSVRAPSRTLRFCFFFLFALEIFAPGRSGVRGGGVRGRGPGRRRRSGNRGVITGLCAANHSRNTARTMRDRAWLTEVYRNLPDHVLFRVLKKCMVLQFQNMSLEVLFQIITWLTTTILKLLKILYF